MSQRNQLLNSAYFILSRIKFGQLCSTIVRCATKKYQVLTVFNIPLGNAERNEEKNEKKKKTGNPLKRFTLKVIFSLIYTFQFIGEIPGAAMSLKIVVQFIY